MQTGPGTKHGRNAAFLGSATMDRQQEFVLRTLEERDIRFVRLWFTDVLGYLKSVAVAPAELEGAFAEGIGFDGSAIEGFARVYESDMVARPDPSTFQVLPWETAAGEHYSARMFCDIAHARRLAVLGRPAARAAPRAVARPARPGSPATCTRRSSSTCCATCPSDGTRAEPGRLRRLLRPGQPRRRPALPAQRDRDAGVDGHLGGVQPPRGRPRASRRSTCATPTR